MVCCAAGLFCTADAFNGLNTCCERTALVLCLCPLHSRPVAQHKGRISVPALQCAHSDYRHLPLFIGDVAAETTFSLLL